MLKYIPVFLVVILVSVWFSTPSYKLWNVVPFTASETPADRVERVLNDMDNEALAAQMVFPVLNVRKYYEDDNYADKIDDLIEKGIGGILISPTQSELIKKFTDEHQGNNSVPLMYCADLENGLYSKEDFSLHLQPLMAWGAMNDSMVTYKSASIIAELAAYLGIHFNLSPVADLNTNPDNAVISVRSFGENPQFVSKQVNTYLKALNDANIAGCVKHFPGHGNTSVDSHYGLPVMQNSIESLWETECLPFRNIYTPEMNAIMIGHIALTSVANGNVPASLSKELITGVIREKMGYNGVVISDALNMQAIQQQYSDSAAAVMACNAGTDILLYPDNAGNTVRAIQLSLQAGLISATTVKNAVRRILLLKEKLGILQGQHAFPVIAKEKLLQDFRVQDELLASRSATYLTKLHKSKPIVTKKNKITHITFYDGSFEYQAGKYHASLKQNPNISSAYLIENRLLKKKEKRSFLRLMTGNEVVISCFLRHSDYSKEQNKNSSLYLLKTKHLYRKNVTVISLRNPFISRIFTDASTYINLYGYSNGATLVANRILNGNHTFEGKSPVTIAGLAVANSSSNNLKNTSSGNSITTQPDFSGLDEIFAKAIKDSIFPGAVALVSYQGNIIYHKAFGKYTYDKNAQLVKKTSIFDLASVSKVIATTTAAMRLISEGSLQLDDKVVKFIPEFAAENKGNITVRNLLLHNSGLTAFKRFYQMYNSEEEVIKDIFQSNLTYTTGTKTVYSDLGMITLGKIIEKITGKSLDEYCMVNVFKPLDMRNTMYNPALKGRKSDCVPTEIDKYWRKRLLQGEVHDEASAMLHGVAGHAGLFSTAEDVAKVLHMLLAKGRYAEKQLIKPEIVNMFLRRQGESSRALGWDTKTEEKSSSGSIMSLGSFGHTGYTGTSVWVDKERGICMVLLTNRVYPTRENMKLGSFRPVFHDTVLKALLQ